MIVKRIELNNFRNYSKLAVAFKDGINFIIGDNANGKTNLVEAIYLLSYAKSFRTNSTNDFIKLGEKEARINSVVASKTFKRTISLIYTGEYKKVLMNEKPIRKLSELNNSCNVLYFIPRDVTLFKDPPKNRKRYLDSTLGKMNFTYLKNVIEYEKILKERNDSLKAYTINYTLLDILTARLISLGKEIFIERKKFFDELNKIINDVYQNLAMLKTKVEIKYTPLCDDENEYEEKLKLLYEKTKNDDLIKKTTQINIHKEDFALYLNDKDIARFGSQGQNRLSVLALKIAPYFLIHEDDKKPILILDDCLSELDEKHENNLINYLSNFNQVFITNTKK